MRYYLDTEFLEDGKTIELISIGVVAEDGREFYAVSSELPWARIVQHEWLMDNVVPSLPLDQDWEAPVLLRSHPDMKSRLDIRRELTTFLLLGNSPVEMWGWYADYDHVVLAQLFGRMIDMPKFIPMWTNDLRQEAFRLGVYTELPVQASGQHNALADARWNKEVGEFLTTYEAEAKIAEYHAREIEEWDDTYS